MQNFKKFFEYCRCASRCKQTARRRYSRRNRTASKITTQRNRPCRTPRHHHRGRLAVGEGRDGRPRRERHRASNGEAEARFAKGLWFYQPGGTVPSLSGHAQHVTLQCRCMAARYHYESPPEFSRRFDSRSIRAPIEELIHGRHHFSSARGITIAGRPVCAPVIGYCGVIFHVSDKRLLFRLTGCVLILLLILLALNLRLLQRRMIL